MTTAFVVCPLSLCMDWGNSFVLSAEVLAGTLAYGLAALTAGCFLYRGDHFHDAISALDSVRVSGNLLPGQLKTSSDEIRWLALLPYFYLAFAHFCTTTSAMTLPFYCLMKREFIIRFWYPVSWNSSPFFEMFFAVFIPVSVTGIYIINANNALLMNLLLLAFEQLKLLNHNLANVITRKSDPGQPTPEPVSGIIISLHSDLEEGNGAKVWPSCEFPRTIAVPNLRSSKTRLVEPRSSPEPWVESLDDEQREKRLERLAESQRQYLHHKAEASMRQCVQHHQAIESYLEKIHTCFEPILIGQFIVTVCASVIGTVAIANGLLEKDAKYYIILALMIGLFSQHALQSYFADKVKEESEAVLYATYDCEWFEASESFKRTMRIIMSRTNQPIVIRVAAFIPLTLETLYGMLKLIHTYYTSMSATFVPAQNITADSP